MTENPRWTYRANRAFGALEQNETVSFDRDDDPVMISLTGAGYLDLVSGPPMEGIKSKEKVGKPSVKMSAPTKKKEAPDE